MTMSLIISPDKTEKIDLKVYDNRHETDGGV